MKLEANLRELMDEPDYGATLAVALLSAMPRDAAELAVRKWRACLDVQDAADAAELDDASIGETLSATPSSVVDPDDDPRTHERVADAIGQFSEPSGSARSKADQSDGAAPTGSDDQLPLRQLVRQAEHQVGRERVWEVFKQHGVTKISAIGPDVEPAFRASLAAIAHES